MVSDVLLASLALIVLVIGISVLRGFALFLAKRGALEPQEAPERPPRKSKQSRK